MGVLDPGPSGRAGGHLGVQAAPWLPCGCHQAKGTRAFKDLVRGQEHLRGGLLVSRVKDQIAVSLIPSEAPGRPNIWWRFCRLQEATM